MRFRRHSDSDLGAAHAETPTPARPEDEKLPAHLNLTYGTQHILAMYAGVITPPLIVGAAAGLSTAEVGILVSAALLLSGLGTLLQTLGIWRVGAQLPLVLGISFVPVATMTVLAEESGLPVVFGATLAGGVFALIVAPFVASLVRFFPPVVTGSVITVIGISLVPVAVGWISEGGEDGVPLTGDLALAGATLFIVLLLSWILPGVWSRTAVLAGLILGTLIAAAFGQVDFSEVREGPLFSFGQPFYFGAPEFQLAAIVIMCIVMMVILTEGVADILAVEEIIGTKVSSRRLADGLRADAVTTIFAPLLNSFPVSTFSQNVGLLVLSRVSSRFAVAFGGGILIVLGLFPVLGRVVAMIPMPVLGGAGLVLFGTVSAAGIRTLAKVDYSRSLNLIIIAVAIGFSVIPIAAPDFFSGFPNWLATVMHSGIVGAAIMALVLNYLFNMLGKPKEVRAADDAVPQTSEGASHDDPAPTRE